MVVKLWILLHTSCRPGLQIHCFLRLAPTYYYIHLTTKHTFFFIYIEREEDKYTDKSPWYMRFTNNFWVLRQFLNDVVTESCYNRTLFLLKEAYLYGMPFYQKLVPKCSFVLYIYICVWMCYVKKMSRIQLVKFINILK